MSEINLFEQASKAKLRFASARGNLTVEDLWDLKLTTGQVSLNDIGVAIQRALKETSADESLVPAAKKADTSAVTTLKLQLAVVKHIIDVKLAEQDVREKAQAKADQRRVLMEALAESQSASLKGKSPEEIQAMIDAL